MHLEGSCHCGKVKFSCESRTPYPFNKCYCSVCRKLDGGGGYSINIMAETDTRAIEGEEHIKVYRSAKNDREVYDEDGLGFSRRSFCSHCGTMLWNYNEQHGQWFYPFASAIDTPLPKPSELRHMMVSHKVDWVEITDDGKQFDQYPDEGIEDWHNRRDLLDEN